MKRFVMNINDFVITSRNVLRQYAGNDKEVWIPEGVTSIAEKAFDQCTQVEIVHVPESVMNIGERAFRLCENLKEINLPSQLKVLKRSVFLHCHNLQHIVFPSTLEVIMDSVFSGCRSLRELHLPESVQEIGVNTFFGCDRVETITLHARLIPELNQAFFRSNARRLTLMSEFTGDIETRHFECFGKLECIYAPQIMQSTVKGAAKKLFLNAFFNDFRHYPEETRADYCKYLNGQKKKLLSQAVAVDNVSLFEMYEQLGIVLSAELQDELMMPAEKKEKVLAWLMTHKNDVASQKAKAIKKESTPKQVSNKYSKGKDKKNDLAMLEGKQDISLNGNDFFIDSQVKQQMSKVRYTQSYDLLIAAEHYMTDEEAEARHLDPLSVASIVSPYVMEDTPELTEEEKRMRKEAFCRACYAAATVEGMELILQSAPKKKNGLLAKNRIVHIATLQMVDQRANTWELYAKAIDETTLEIGIRKIVCKESEINRIKGYIAGQQDLFEINNDFKQICTTHKT